MMGSTGCVSSLRGRGGTKNHSTIFQTRTHGRPWRPKHHKWSQMERTNENGYWFFRLSFFFSIYIFLFQRRRSLAVFHRIHISKLSAKVTHATEPLLCFAGNQCRAQQQEVLDKKRCVIRSVGLAVCFHRWKSCGYFPVGYLFCAHFFFIPFSSLPLNRRFWERRHTVSMIDFD